MNEAFACLYWQMDPIKKLLRRHLNGELSPAEQIELDSWLNESEANRRLFEELNDPAYVSASLSRLDQFNETHAWKEVQARLAGKARKETVEGETSKPSRSLLWRRSGWVAAAAVLVLAAAGYYWYPATRKAFDQTIITARGPIVPGSNKAILTLANGRQVVLDSLADGSVALQNGVRVIKLDSGRLAYTGSPDGTMPGYNTLTVPRGGQFQVILPDSSRVWLNSASSLRYPTTFTKSRQVELTGEGYFEIVKNPQLPFAVTVRGVTVNVLGTDFNIMAYDDEDAIRTTLADGAVRVSEGKDNAYLHPGEQASLISGQHRFQISEPDFRQALAWKEGKFRFEGNDIAMIMRQVARWYDVKIVYKGNLSDISLLGVISRRESVVHLLAILEATHKVHFEVEGSSIIVMPGNR